MLHLDVPESGCGQFLFKHGCSYGTGTHTGIAGKYDFPDWPGCGGTGCGGAGMHPCPDVSQAEVSFTPFDAFFMADIFFLESSNPHPYLQISAGEGL